MTIDLIKHNICKILLYIQLVLSGYGLYSVYTHNSHYSLVITHIVIKYDALHF